MGIVSWGEFVALELGLILPDGPYHLLIFGIFFQFPFLFNIPNILQLNFSQFFNFLKLFFLISPFLHLIILFIFPLFLEFLFLYSLQLLFFPFLSLFNLYFQLFSYLLFLFLFYLLLVNSCVFKLEEISGSFLVNIHQLLMLDVVTGVCFMTLVYLLDGVLVELGWVVWGEGIWEILGLGVVVW
jgi:hypothetical protein